MNFPKVSIIVPVYNSESILDLCLQSLLNLDYPKNLLEIIIVDNASTDDSKKIIEKYPVIYIYEQKNTSYAARNKGIRMSSGEIIAFTDSDCIVDPGWVIAGVEMLLKNMESNDRKSMLVLAGRVEAYQPESIIEIYTAKIGVLDQMKNISRAVRLATCNGFFYKPVFEKAGLFDEDLFSGGDTEMSWRIQTHGYTIGYCDTAIIYHKHRTRLLNLYEQFFRYGYGSIYVWRKYGKEEWINYRKAWFTACANLSKLVFAKNKSFAFLDYFTSIAYLSGQLFRELKNRGEL